MGKNTNKSINVILGLNMTQFQKGLRTAQARLKRFGKTMSRFGSSMSRSVTLPLVGAGLAGVKLASDLEKSFAKIENLVGVTGPVLEGFKTKLKEISTETATSQRSLADALFVITSAGIRSAEAMDILAASAKSSQVGMGETEAIARGITGAMNSYAKAGLTAARSADIMMAIVREGNLVAEDLAPTLGRVTGMAAELGISFEELGANIATFTRLGVPTEEAVTGLRGVMAAVLKPTKAAEEVLASIGMTSSDVRKKVGKEGLHGTLMFLVDALKGNEKGLSAMFGNVRALSNVLGTAGAQGESYAKILDSITNSMGMVDGAFKNVSEISAFKFDAAIVALKNNAIELGAQILPVVVNIVNGITKVIKRFRELSPEIKRAAVVAAVLLAAVGPLAMLIGTASAALSTLAGVLITISGPMGLFTVVAAGMAAGVMALEGVFGKSTRSISDNEKALQGNRAEANKLLEAIKDENVAQDTRNRLIKKFNDKFGSYAGNLSTEKTKLSDILKVQKNLNIAFNQRIKDTVLEEKKTKLFNDQLKTGRKQVKEEEKLVELLALKTERQAEYEEIKASGNTSNELLFAWGDLKATESAITESEEIIEGFKKTIDEAAESYKKLESALSTGGAGTDPDPDPDPGTGTGTGTIEKLYGDALDAAIATLGLEHALRDLDTYILGNRRGPESVDYAPGILGLHNMALGLVEYGDELRSLSKNRDLPKIDLDLDLSEMSHIFSEASDELDDFNEGFVDLDGNIKLIAKTAANSFDMAGAIVTEFGNSMQMAFQGAIENGESFWENMKNMLRQLTIKLIAAAAAAIVLAIAITVATGGANIGGKTLAGLDLAKAIFSDLSGLPKFAEGGMVFGPTLAMVGDNRNAGVDPEVIAPLSKLKAMMGGTGSQNVIVTGRLSGSDLLISNERAGRQRSRYRGF